MTLKQWGNCTVTTTKFAKSTGSSEQLSFACCKGFAFGIAVPGCAVLGLCLLVIHQAEKRLMNHPRLESCHLCVGLSQPSCPIDLVVLQIGEQLC